MGDGNTGKTALVISYSLGEFPSKYIPTVFENYSIKMFINDILHEVTLLDTAGQEDYDRLRPLMYPGTDCIVLCFSIGCITTFNNIESRVKSRL